MRVSFFKKIKNVLAEIFKKKGKKIENEVGHTPESPVKSKPFFSKNNGVWKLRGKPKDEIRSLSDIQASQKNTGETVKRRKNSQDD